MWAPFHKSIRRRKVRVNYNDLFEENDSRNSLDFLDEEMYDLEEEGEDELSEFFLKEPVTERVHFENKIIEDLEIGHSSIQGTVIYTKFINFILYSIYLQK